MYAVSTCALPVASWPWQPRASTWALTVVCRATFVLRPGECVLAAEQDPLVEDDQHLDDDEHRSLRAPTDLVPLKLRADVTLVGHAYAPGGVPVSTLTARLRVGEVDKVVELHADATFDQEGTLHRGARFSRMVLGYERAAGGPDTGNPVGVRAVRDTFGRVALPNLYPPGLSIASAADHVPPIGFGPIPPTWPGRREKRGRHVHGPAPDGQREPLPEDLDLGFFNHAPPDQQLAALRVDERLVLENLHPDHPRLVTSLPGLSPRAFVERRGSASPLALAPDTLWVDTDRGLCAVTFRGQVPLESPEEEGRVIVALGNGGPTDDDRVVQTLVPAMGPRKTVASRVLPFALGRSGVAEAPRPEEPPGALPFHAGPPRASHEGYAGVPEPAAVSHAAPVPAAVTFGAPPPAPSFGMPPPALASAVAAPVAPVAAPHGAFWPAPEAVPYAPPQPVAAKTVGQMAIPSEPRLPTSVAPATSPPAPAPAAEPARAATRAEPRPAAPAEPRKAVQILWFDPECLPRLRRKAAWRPLLERIDERPLDPDLDDPSIARDPMAVEDRRDVFEVVARAEPAEEGQLAEALERGLRDDGKFVAPFLVVGGELRLPFDELAALKAAVSVAGPFAPGDDGLETALGDARRLLETPDLVCPPPVLEGFTTRIHEAFRKMRRTTAPAGYLEEAVERALLERRAFQRREVFGGPHLRALLAVGGARPWPLYLPEASVRRLPLFQRFQARVIVEGWLQEDQHEQHPAALRAFALARVTPMPTLVVARAPAKG